VSAALLAFIGLGALIAMIILTGVAILMIMLDRPAGRAAKDKGSQS
jgi:hypothetical protein